MSEEFDFDVSALTEEQVSHLREYKVYSLAQFLDILRDQRVEHMGKDNVPGPISSLCETCEEIAGILKVG